MRKWTAHRFVLLTLQSGLCFAAQDYDQFVALWRLPGFVIAAIMLCLIVLAVTLRHRIAWRSKRFHLFWLGDVMRRTELHKELPLGYTDSIVDILMSDGQLDEAEKVLTAKAGLKLLFLGNSRTEKKVTAIDHGTWGNLHTYRNNLEDAEAHYKKALKIFLELDNHSEGIGISYANLGGIYELRGDIPKAMDCWQEARFVFSVIGDEWRGDLVAKWLENIEKRA